MQDLPSDDALKLLRRYEGQLRRCVAPTPEEMSTALDVALAHLRARAECALRDRAGADRAPLLHAIEDALSVTAAACRMGHVSASFVRECGDRAWNTARTLMPALSACWKIAERLHVLGGFDEDFSGVFDRWLCELGQLGPIKILMQSSVPSTRKAMALSAEAVRRRSKRPPR